MEIETDENQSIGKLVGVSPNTSSSPAGQRKCRAGHECSPPCRSVAQSRNAVEDERTRHGDAFAIGLAHEGLSIGAELMDGPASVPPFAADVRGDESPAKSESAAARSAAKRAKSRPWHSAHSSDRRASPESPRRAASSVAGRRPRGDTGPSQDGLHGPDIDRRAAVKGERHGRVE